uniref:Uncharacterized protein n=1 Tax=Physcomitrium patens TaxID=3218 RepID=A0A2K1K091_PHYPA|nr:hypothetical protein PHYPA_014310 [Physcomitrium patens]
MLMCYAKAFGAATTSLMGPSEVIPRPTNLQRWPSSVQPVEQSLHLAPRHADDESLPCTYLRRAPLVCGHTSWI